MTPSPLAQRINQSLHKEPIASIFHKIFWSFILIIICPLIGLAFLISSPVLILYAAINDRRRIDPYRYGELAVVLTGCDCGFGRDAAFALGGRGFVVFAGCRSVESSGKQFAGANNIIPLPLQMDVTNLDEIAAAVETVAKWTAEEPDRYVHAIINNAGKGEVSLFDWYKSKEKLQSDMDVNFYGALFVIQHFLPLLKKQAKHNGLSNFKPRYGNKQNVKPRIINVVSMAGLVTGSVGASMYHASKYAMEGFVGCLRTELHPFGIDVININPSFHRTNIIHGVADRLRMSWENIPHSRKSQYSEGTVNHIATKLEQNFSRTLWEPHVVVDAIVSATELQYPSCQYLVGSDAKTVHLLMRLLPQSIVTWLINKDLNLRLVK